VVDTLGGAGAGAAVCGAVELAPHDKVEASAKVRANIEIFPGETMVFDFYTRTAPAAHH
jgi:hypothetical protein